MELLSPEQAREYRVIALREVVARETDPDVVRAAQELLLELESVVRLPAAIHG